MRRLLRISLLAALAVFVFALPACDSGAPSSDPEPEPNQSPTADFTAAPDNPRAGTSVDFSANASDPDGAIESYSWDFDGDGDQDASGSTASYTFEERGSASASLTVTDDRGGSDTATQSLSVTQRFTSVTITRVQLDDMPFVRDDGSNWDAIAGGPDVFYAIFDGDDEQVRASDFYNGTSPQDLPLEWEEGFVIGDLEETHAFVFGDGDQTGSEIINGAQFTFQEATEEYPEQVSEEVGEIALTLDLEWGNEEGSAAVASSSFADREQMNPPADLPHLSTGE